MRMSLDEVVALVKQEPTPTVDMILSVATSLRRLLSTTKAPPVKAVLSHNLDILLLRMLEQDE